MEVKHFVRGREGRPHAVETGLGWALIGEHTPEPTKTGEPPGLGEHTQQKVKWSQEDGGANGQYQGLGKIARELGGIQADMSAGKENLIETMEEMVSETRQEGPQEKNPQEVSEPTEGEWQIVKHKRGRKAPSGSRE